MIPIIELPKTPDTYTTIEGCNHEAYYVSVGPLSKPKVRGSVPSRWLLIQYERRWTWLYIGTGNLYSSSYATHREAITDVLQAGAPGNLYKIETKEELFTWLTTPPATGDL